MLVRVKKYVRILLLGKLGGLVVLCMLGEIN